MPQSSPNSIRFQSLSNIEQSFIWLTGSLYVAFIHWVFVYIYRSHLPLV